MGVLESPSGLACVSSASSENSIIAAIDASKLAELTKPASRIETVSAGNAEKTQPSSRVEAPKPRLSITEAAKLAKENAANRQEKFWGPVKKLIGGVVKSTVNVYLMSEAMTNEADRKAVTGAIAETVTRKKNELVKAGNEILKDIDNGIGEAGVIAFGALGKGLNVAVESGQQLVKDLSAAGKESAKSFGKEAVTFGLEVTVPAASEVVALGLEALRMGKEAVANATAMPKEFAADALVDLGTFIAGNIVSSETFDALEDLRKKLEGDRRKQDVISKNLGGLFGAIAHIHEVGLDLWGRGIKHRRAAEKIRGAYAQDESTIKKAQGELDTLGQQAKNRALI